MRSNRRLCGKGNPHNTLFLTRVPQWGMCMCPLCVWERGALSVSAWGEEPDVALVVLQDGAPVAGRAEQHPCEQRYGVRLVDGGLIGHRIQLPESRRRATRRGSLGVALQGGLRRPALRFTAWPRTRAVLADRGPPKGRSQHAFDKGIHGTHGRRVSIARSMRRAASGGWCISLGGRQARPHLPSLCSGVGEP